MKFAKTLVILAFLWSMLSSCGPSAPTPAIAIPPRETFEYEVKEGDTCNYLAEEFDTTIEEIVALNGLVASCPIMIDQVLRIPVTGAAQSTEAPIAVTEVPTYDNNGVTVYRKAEFPQTPATMKVYSARDEQMATADNVKALAKQFKMDGAIYELDAQSGIPGGMLGGEKEYLVVDGNRQLRVRSDKYFTYVPDNVSHTNNLVVLPPANAESLIKEFMQAYGFNSAYKIEQADTLDYAALALSPEGLDVRYTNLQFDGLLFSFNKDGIAFVRANLLYYDQTTSMEIISAEEALQKLLDSSDTFGHLQSGGGGGFLMIDGEVLKSEDFRKWTRIYPLDETITYFGYLSSSGKSVAGGMPLILLNGYTVVGNTNGISENTNSMFIEARGKFHDANGVKTFEMESWKKYDNGEETVLGALQREGGQLVITEGSGKKHILEDVPADIPLPMKYAFAHGVTRSGVFDWNVIDNYGGGGGGGGGGGPSGFYKINFSGTPVTFPRATPTMPVPTPVIKPVEGLRGTLQVNVFPQSDGTERISYQIIPYEGPGSDSPMGENLLQLKGKFSDELKAYNNFPIDVWGTIVDNNELTVERYEIPYPDLQFELVHGSQKLETIEGQSYTIVTTTDGKKYIVLAPSGAPSPMQLSDPAFVPDPTNPAHVPNPNANDVIYEALVIPGETLFGYPGMRVYITGPGMLDGKPNTLTIIDDQPNVFPPQTQLTSMTIEKIELAYFAADNMYANTNPIYVQPVWRFYGHYNDDTPFEILIQALKRGYLLPEVDPATGP